MTCFFSYENLIKTYKVLDGITTDSVILALSLTDQWNMCIQLLDDVKKTGNPTASSYTAIMAASFRNGKNEFAWKIAQEMIGIYIYFLTALIKIRLKQALETDENKQFFSNFCFQLLVMFISILYTINPELFCLVLFQICGCLQVFYTSGEL